MGKYIQEQVEVPVLSQIEDPVTSQLEEYSEPEMSISSLPDVNLLGASGGGWEEEPENPWGK